MYGTSLGSRKETLETAKLFPRIGRLTSEISLKVRIITFIFKKACETNWIIFVIFV